MLQSLRLLVLSASFLASAALCYAGARQTDSTPPTPQYACVRLDADGDHDADDGARIRLVSADEHCRGHETRMLVVLSETTPFVADARPPIPPADTTVPTDAVFTSRFLDRFAAVPASAPLLIQASLLIDADRGLFGIAPPAVDVNPVVNGRGEPSNVSCVPLLDGQRLGALTRLLSRRVKLGQPAGVVFDPQTRQFDQPSPGYFPDVFWSRLEDSREVISGRHEFAIACQGGLAFRFRGTGSLLVLQEAPRR